MEFNHNHSGIQYKDEGPMQYFTVPTQKLEVYEYVYISVWAVNEVMYIYCDISYAELVSAISNGISVPQWRNIMELFIIIYPKKQILGGTNIFSQN